MLTNRIFPVLCSIQYVNEESTETAETELPH